MPSIDTGTHLRDINDLDPARLREVYRILRLARELRVADSQADQR